LPPSKILSCPFPCLPSQLQAQGNHHLNDYNEILNAIIDDKLMSLINLEEESSNKVSNVQQLMTSCSRIIIGALESSPPQLQSTAKLFINRSVMSQLLSSPSLFFCPFLIIGSA
jgi:hypothetical protein